MVKRLSTMRETWVQSLGREHPLEKEMAVHSSTIAWKIPWTEEPGRLQSMGSQSQTRLRDFPFLSFHCLYTPDISLFLKPTIAFVVVFHGIIVGTFIVQAWGWPVVWLCSGILCFVLYLVSLLFFPTFGEFKSEHDLNLSISMTKEARDAFSFFY